MQGSDEEGQDPLEEFREARDIRKGFYQYISSKRKSRENMGLLQNQMGPDDGRHREGGTIECLLCLSHYC